MTKQAGYYFGGCLVMILAFHLFPVEPIWQRIVAAAAGAFVIEVRCRG